MLKAVFIDKKKVKLEPSALLGQGGEAEVYDLHDGRVVKVWKPPTHPDFDGLPEAQAAATKRVAEAPARLAALPAHLPPAVVAPIALAYANAREVCGYVMPKVSGVPLHSYGEPRWRRDHPIAGAEVVAALLSLHDALAGLHRAGIVVGDCNDLNVLVDGKRVFLIDVDSYQLPGFPCAMFSERFVDPRLCDTALVPIRAHDRDSDWFAFAAMAFRTLLGVGPWGGVHQPADPALRCPPLVRALRRISVLAADIVYPRAARVLATLPDDLIATFREIFERDRRGEFPRDQLARLHLRACAACGDEHARVRCPACQTQAYVPPAVVHGKLRWQAIAADAFAAPTYRVGRGAPAHHARRAEVWLDAGALWRSTRLGPERIGNVLAEQTHAWAGERLGVGFYRAGGYGVGFVFRPDRGQLDDRVQLPKIRGRVVATDATVGNDRAWLWITTIDAGRLATTCIVIGSDASVIATETLADATWLAGIGGACAHGGQLFVPTDDGIARVEIVQGAIVQTRTFAETAPLVGAGDQLAIAGGAILVRRKRDVLRLELA